MLNISVNCYLVRAADGFILIDTGMAGRRGAIERQLENAGCRPGNLKLIVLTHGDFDHSGNAAYLGKKFGAPIAMHADDAGMVERGDMFWHRHRPNVLMRAASGLLFRLGQADRFEPDVRIGEGFALSTYGFDATVLHLPGHSSGHIGILTADGDLFCGDLLGNTGNRPERWSIVDDLAVMNASVERVKGLAVRTVYPGHGQPFPLESLVKSNG